VSQEQSNNWHETHQTAIDRTGGYTGKFHRYNDRQFCRLLPIKEAVETHVTSDCLSIDCLEVKTDHMQNKFMHIESAARHNPHEYII
jgi:hypothetical protein